MDEAASAVREWADDDVDMIAAAEKIARRQHQDDSAEILRRIDRESIQKAVDLLAAVPSVIYGLWGILFFVPFVVRPLMDWLATSVGRGKGIRPLRHWYSTQPRE